MAGPVGNHSPTARPGCSFEADRPELFLRLAASRRCTYAETLLNIEALRHTTPHEGVGSRIAAYLFRRVITVRSSKFSRLRTNIDNPDPSPGWSPQTAQAWCRSGEHGFRRLTRVCPTLQPARIPDRCFKVSSCVALHNFAFGCCHLVANETPPQRPVVSRPVQNRLSLAIAEVAGMSLF